MRKILNKFLAVFVSFVMAITMIPLSGIVSHAETTVGDQSTVKTYYEKVNDPTTLETGDEVLITYGTKALVANSNRTLTEGPITENDNKLTEVPDGSVWKVNKPYSWSNKYFFETEKVAYYNRVKVDDKGIGIGDESSPFTVTSDSKIYREKYGRKNDYSITYDNGFKGQVDEKASNSKAFTFYKKVEGKVKLTINYKLDENTPSKVEKEVKAGDTVNINDSFPSGFGNLDDYEVEKIEYNGSNIGTDSQIKVNGDAEITVYYKKADKVNFTVNVYVNGNKKESSTNSVKKNSTQNVDLSKYDTNYIFDKMIVNGKEKDKTNEFTITEDLEVSYYYTTVDAPDAVEPDGTLDGKDQPDYPNQGAVKIDKTAKGNNFDKTGIGDVELSVKGVSVKKGVDVVLVLDVSDSMNNNSKLTNAKTSAKTFVNSVLGDNADGTASNNRLALVTFSGDESQSSSTSGNEIKYGLKNYKSKDSIVNTINGLESKVGTDYNYAFEAANSILDSADDDRPKFVVFMTDGAPSSFTNNSGTKYSWYDYSNATDFASDVMSNPYLQGAETAKNKAKVYSIAFGLGSDPGNGFNSTQATTILQNISSGDNYFVNAANGDELQAAFDSIAGDIKKAGTNASVNDVIGQKFELSYKYPISVTLHDVYTYSDYNSGKCTYEKIGTRKGTSQTVETITFSKDGTQAYSDKIGSNTNIFNNGVINAKTFTYTVATKTFEWKLGKISGDTTTGDISEQEITLNYSVYLTGSTEGDCDPGTYDTNKSAVLTYTSYKDKTETQTFPVPSLSWGAANVNVEYYLVNENGEPINTAGQVVPPGYKVTVGNLVSVSIKKGESKEILATEYLPEGYELQYSSARYKVNHPGFDDATVESSKDEQGDLSTLIEGEAPYSDTKVSFGVLLNTDLQEDTVVLDYGKPVTINVRENDGFQSATLNSVSKVYDASEVALNTGTSYSLQKDFKTEESNNYGTLKVKDENKVTYTPNKYMDGIDKYYYAVKGSTTKDGQTVDAYKYSSVSIIPATSVYYEDNFGGAGTDNQTGGIYFNKNIIKPVGTDTGKEQSSENNNYGNDSSYSEDATDSNGSSTKITGNGEQAATFTFTGTGFDLVGRTTTETGEFMINVYAGDTVGDIKDRISSQIVVTKYESGNLYQIPVYNWNCSEYRDASGKAYTNGQYTVEIKVARNEIFYLDAVRIYNPIDVSQNTEDATTAKDAYDKADESNPQINEIRELLLTQNESDSSNFGAVFVDTNGEAGFDKFKEIGPNNEVYLAPGQSVGFNISADSVPKTIQIGAKAPNGQATFTAYTDGEDSTQSVPVGTQTLKTATDMYYKLDTSKIKFVNGKAYIMISNTGDSNVISITNIKLTFDNAETKATFVANEEVIAKTKARTLALNKVVEPVEILNAEFTTSSVKVNKESTLVVTTSSNAKDITILDSNGNEVTPTSESNKLDSNGNKVFTFTIKHTTQGINNYKVIANGEGNSTSESVDVSINVKKQTLLDIISSWFK